MYLASSRSCLTDLLEDILEDQHLPPETTCQDVDDNPIRVVVCEASFGPILEQLQQKCKTAGWLYQVISCEQLPGNPSMSHTETNQVMPYLEPSNPILKTLKKIQNAMGTLNCALHRGHVYVKPKEATFTCCKGPIPLTKRKKRSDF